MDLILSRSFQTAWRSYNVDEKESAVYYQIDNGTSNGLYVKDLEGGEVRKIADGNYNYLHLTSKYLFY